MPQNKTARQSYSFGYGYTLSGALATETYPSQRHVGYKYDTAGRVSLVSNGPLGITPLSYATNFSYTPQGTISGMTLGNGVTQTTGYNNRLQIQSIGAAKGGANLLGLTYSYPPATNNGSLSSQQIHHDAVGSEAALNVTQNYSSYDAMNRLAAFGEGTVSQTYGHDNYGNHWVNPSSTGYALNSLTPTGPTAFGPDNRLAAQSYDGRGNQTSYTPYTLAYDGDDQQISATSPQNDSASYQYDADGQRVVKMTCSNATPCTSSSSSLVTTIYVYDAMGQVAAEYSTQPATGGTQYLTSDHLGSTRMVTDSGGNVVQRHDYLPFGEELFAGMNGRSSLYPAAPQVGMLYTGQLRDEKTELDFFNARYFAGPEARFTGPDGPFNDQDVSDPQSWNLYTYVRNDPLNGTDPSGEVEQLPSFGEVCGNPCNVTAPSPPIPFSWGDPSLCRVLPGACNFGTRIATQTVQQFTQYAQPVIDWIKGPRDPNCVASAINTIGGAGAAAGTVIGGAAGAAGGTLALPGGGTIGGAYAGGAAGGGAGYAAGGALGAITGYMFCSTGNGGGGPGTGGGKGGKPAHKYAGKTVAEILKGKKGSIKSAPLDPGSPTWDGILTTKWEDIDKGAKAGKAGYDTIRKLLTDTRFDK